MFVGQIGFEHTGARVGDFYRERILVHFEHCNVLELVSLLFADVNPAAGELINDLIASKKCHWVTRRQIEDGAAQSFLRGWRNLHIEPEAESCAKKPDPSKWDANARDAHAV